MDPVSTLSLVANIFGVLAFAKDVVAVALQIHQHGDSRELLRLQETARSLDSAVTELNPRPTSAEPGPAPAEEDASIIQIAQDITRTSQRISKLLEDVRGGKGRPWPSKLQTPLQVFKTIWNRDIADELAKEVSDAQQRLHLHATLSIKAKLDKHTMRLEDAVRSLDKSSRALLPSFLASFDELSAKCDDVLEGQTRSEELATARHLEIIGSLDAIRTRSPYSETWSKQLSGEQINKVEETILVSLWSSFLGDREGMIQEAHKKTFNWIFQDQSEIRRPWDDFGAFLRDGQSGTYWISGKPGSGKSTLMKYLFGHETTKQLLLQWAGQYDLVMARFYFSHGGSEPLTSEAGALRCLLYQILDKHRSLIQLSFPERHRALCISPDHQEVFEPTVIELRRALKTVVQQCPNIFFFLVVDALDEQKVADEDMGVLASTLRDITKYPNLKAVLSSRPWNVFDQTFAGCPQLRLHELTRPDIVQFVESKIGDHPRIQKLAGKAIPGLAELKTEIVDASCGVFLWVHLAVRSVLQGLTDHDTIEDLRSWVRGLPSDLEELYRRIWHSIPDRHRTQAARLLLLTEAGGFGHWRQGLLSLSFAEAGDTNYAFAAPIEPLEEHDIESRLETMRARLSSRCMGLLEVRREDLPEYDQRGDEDHRAPRRNSPDYQRAFVIVLSTAVSDCYPNSAGPSHDHAYVDFLHRTVREFILSSDVRHHILSSAAGDTGYFSPETNLLHSALLRLKSFSHMEAVRPPLIRSKFPLFLEGFVHRVLVFADHFERATNQPATEAVLELDRVMQHFQQALLLPSLPSCRHWSNALSVFPQAYMNGMHVADADDIVPLCIQHGLFLFVREHIARAGPQCLTQANGESLLKYAMLSKIGLLHPPEIDMVSLLLESGATPNDRVGNTSAWRHFLHEALSYKMYQADPVMHLLKLFLVHGAELTSDMGDPTGTGLQGARRLYELYYHRLTHDPAALEDAPKSFSLAAEVDQLLGRLEAQHNAQQANVCLQPHSGQGKDGFDNRSEELGETTSISKQQADGVQSASDQRSDSPGQVHQCAASAQRQPQGPAPGDTDQDQLESPAQTGPRVSSQPQPSEYTTDNNPPAELGPRREEGVMEQQAPTSQHNAATEPSWTNAQGLGGTTTEACGHSFHKASVIETHEQLALNHVEVEENKDVKGKPSRIGAQSSGVRSLLCCFQQRRRE